MEKLTDISEWEEFLATSHKHPIALFKFSNNCWTSKNSFERLQSLLENNTQVQKQVRHLIVQQSRELSDHIETNLGIVHETPQVIVLIQGEVFYYQSHEQIHIKKVEELLVGKE